MSDPSAGGGFEIPQEIPEIPQEILDALAALAGQQGEVAPIGVPFDYAATTPIPNSAGIMPPSMRSTPPRYFEGDEYKLIRNAPPERVLNLQEQLVNAGFLDPDEGITLGAWQGGTVNAFRGLLQYANIQGIDWQGALKQATTMFRLYGTSPLGGDGTGRDGRPHVVVNLSDPAGLKDGADTVAQRVLGRKATAQEQNLIVSTIHAMQRDAQIGPQLPDDPAQEKQDTAVMFDQARDALRTGTPIPEDPAGSMQARVSEITQPDIEARTEDALRAQNPQEAGGKDISNAFSTFENILRGGIR